MKTIIFDFDGVILDSFRANYDTACLFFDDLGEKEYRTWFYGNIYERKTDKVRKKTNFDFFEEYEKKILKLGVNPGFHEALKKLKKDHDLLINSSTPEEIVEKYLEKNGLGNVFKEIFGYDSSQSKVEKFKSIFKKYNFRPEECLFVTDTLGDILEANEVGVRSVAVDFGFHSRDVLEQGKPIKIISDIKDIFQVIDVG